MLLAAAFVLLAQPAPAQTVVTAPPAPAATTAAQKKVCRREENLGTIIAKRVCRTAAEWSAIDAENARAAERFGNDRDNSRGMRPGG